MRLTVNGVQRELPLPPLETLLHALREELGITSPKAGCQEGGCGACTVLVEGEPRRACLVPAALDAVVWIQDVHNAGGLFVGPAPGVAGCLHRKARGSVVRAIPGQDFRPARDRPRDLDRVLVGVRAAECEEDLVDVTRQQLGQLLAQTGAGLRGHEGADVGQPVGLGLDRVDDPAIAVAGVHAHELAVEVDEAAAVHGLEAHAFGARDRHRLDARLG